MYDQYWCIFSEIFLHDCCDNSRLGVSQWSQSASSDPRVHVHVNSDLISLSERQETSASVYNGRGQESPDTRLRSDHVIVMVIRNPVMTMTLFRGGGNHN